MAQQVVCSTHYKDTFILFLWWHWITYSFLLPFYSSVYIALRSFAVSYEEYHDVIGCTRMWQLVRVGGGSSTVAAADYPKISDADWSIQILS